MTDPQGTTCPKGDCGHITILVPEGKHMVDGLTLAELDIASRKIGADVVLAMQVQEHDDGTFTADPGRYRAQAQVGWLWARRTDPQAKVETFLGYTTDEMSHALGIHRAKPQPAGEDGAAQDPPGLPEEPESD